MKNCFLKCCLKMNMRSDLLNVWIGENWLKVSRSVSISRLPFFLKWSQLIPPEVILVEHVIFLASRSLSSSVEGKSDLETKCLQSFSKSKIKITPLPPNPCPPHPPCDPEHLGQNCICIFIFWQLVESESEGL